jgi:hypothetical protein
LVEKRITHGAGVKVDREEHRLDFLRGVSLEEGFAGGFNTTVTQCASWAEVGRAGVVQGREKAVDPSEDFLNRGDEVRLVS